MALYALMANKGCSSSEANGLVSSSITFDFYFDIGHVLLVYVVKQVYFSSCFLLHLLYLA